MGNTLTENVTAKILVADDDEKIRLAITDILSNEGYEILETSEGDEVVPTVREREPDVILLDINMPKMDGLEITQYIKSEEDIKHIPIIIITGENDLDVRLQAFKLGADDYLEKPFHFPVLIARVKNLVKVKSYYDYMKNHQEILEIQVQERTKQLKNAMTELKQASLDTILRLSRAAEYRDKDTSTHLIRMSKYAEAVARTAGLAADTVETILHTAPMHDIGKIGVPDSILLKPGKLTAEEWELMQQHTVFGGSILNGSENKLLQVGEKIALTHHEKWDGTGYPSGLKGENIPMEGRITAIADVFDAFTSKRPYKKAYSPEEGFSLISEGKGRHFDPYFTDIFLSISEEVLLILKNTT